MFPHKASVEYMYEESGPSRTRVDHDFGDTFGRTEEEAREMMEERIESWKADQD